jgi:hypothetical protein
MTGLLLCGCSPKQSSKFPSIDQIQAGKDLVWNGGSSVLHVTKRDGNSLEGIQIVATASDGQKTTTTADTGTLTPGSVENAADNSYVRITLHNGKSQNAKVQMTAQEIMIVLHE